MLVTRTKCIQHITLIFSNSFVFSLRTQHKIKHFNRRKTVCVCVRVWVELKRATTTKRCAYIFANCIMDLNLQDTFISIFIHFCVVLDAMANTRTNYTSMFEHKSFIESVCTKCSKWLALLKHSIAFRHSGFEMNNNRKVSQSSAQCKRSEFAIRETSVACVTSRFKRRHKTVQDAKKTRAHKSVKQNGEKVYCVHEPINNSLCLLINKVDFLTNYLIQRFPFDMHQIIRLPSTCFVNPHKRH